MKPLPTVFPAVLSTAGAEGGHLLPLGQILTAPADEAGETLPFSLQIAQIKSSLRNGAAPVLADCGMTVAQQRAALLACKDLPAQPPFIACLALNADGETFDNWQAGAALILLQSMGCAGVLLTSQDEEAAAEMPALIAALYEDARIPLGAVLSLEDARQKTWPLPHLSFLMAADSHETEALAQYAAEKGFFDHLPAVCPPKEPDYFIAVSNGNAFLLDPTFDIDIELECSADFIDELMEAENAESIASLRLVIDDEDALARFAEEQYMIHLPLCLRTSDEALFEQALVSFCGRAMYDGTFELEESLLRRLVERYGLIVL
ncbi:hypothetical protein [Acidaminobacterium chupaoyuni]